MRFDAYRSYATALAGHDADDLLQEAAIAMIEHPPAREGALHGWIRTVILNRWRMTARSTARRRRRELAVAVATDPEWHDPLERRGTYARLHAAIEALPDPYRSHVIACYFEGKTSAEIAAAAGVPAITVRTRLYRAIAKLRAALAQ